MFREREQETISTIMEMNSDILYDQAGNSIAVPIFESIFRKIILQEVA